MGRILLLVFVVAEIGCRAQTPFTSVSLQNKECSTYEYVSLCVHYDDWSYQTKNIRDKKRTTAHQAAQLYYTVGEAWREVGLEMTVPPERCFKGDLIIASTKESFSRWCSSIRSNPDVIACTQSQPAHGWNNNGLFYATYLPEAYNKRWVHVHEAIHVAAVCMRESGDGDAAHATKRMWSIGSDVFSVYQRALDMIHYNL